MSTKLVYLSVLFKVLNYVKERKFKIYINTMIACVSICVINSHCNKTYLLFCIFI